MVKKKTEPTFGDLLDVANANIADMRNQHGEKMFIVNLIWLAFGAACKIAIERDYYPEFGADLAAVIAHHQEYPLLKNTELFWKRWPAAMTTFGRYQFEGSSALDVARRFVETVNSSAMIARVSEFNQFDSDAFSQPELERWASALAKELATALDFTTWSRGVLRRDFNLLYAQLGQELAQKPRATEKTITISMVCKLLKDALQPDGSTISHSRRTVDAWAKNWTVVKRSKKTVYYGWDDARYFILTEYQYDIQEPGDSKIRQ